MTAYELMDRMSMPELLEWIERDGSQHDPAWTRTAMLLAKIDAVTWRKGQRRPDVRRYLPAAKVPRPAKGRRGDVGSIRLRLDHSLGRLSMASFGLAPAPAAGDGGVPKKGGES